MKNILIICAITLMACNRPSHPPKLINTIHGKAKGLSCEASIMRRDPSDIIKVKNTYYIWYSKRYLKDGTHLFPGDHNAANGYHADIWYATSKNGKEWEEKGVCVKKGGMGDWDGQSAFTPNILVWKNKYYLFYTGAPKPFTNQGNKVTKTAIGIAVSDSPDGPWEKLDNPALLCSDNPDDFDSMRVDDACLVVRDGKIYFYYKGRKWDDTPGHTKMGVAIAENPEGPYLKHGQNPIIKGGHEVMVWPFGTGVVAMINIGPEGLKQTLQYSPDGIHFSTLQSIGVPPKAAGFYRPEAFTGSKKGKMPEWGIEIEKQKDKLPGLGWVGIEWTTK